MVSKNTLRYTPSRRNTHADTKVADDKITGQVVKTH